MKINLVLIKFGLADIIVIYLKKKKFCWFCLELILRRGEW